MISILIFTIDIINQIPIIILYPDRLVFLIFRINYRLTEPEGLEQPEGGTPALNVIAIRDRCRANVSKHRTSLADVDVAPPHSTD